MKHRPSTMWFEVMKQEKIFFYTIYGLKVQTNIHLPLLQLECPSEDVDLNLYVNFSFFENSHLSVYEKENYYVVELYDYANYYIFQDSNRIVCNAKNFESFFSTFFNIPFSIYLTLKQSALIHACSLIYDGLYCFMGVKGIGKTTLTHLLSLGNNFKMFSDDTTRITNSCIGYAPHNLCKHTDENLSSLNITNTCNRKNVTGKSYVCFDKTVEKEKVLAFIQLSRSQNQLPTIKKIKSLALAKSIVYGNITGISFYTKLLINRVESLDFLSNIAVYKLSLPNDLTTLRQSTKKIEELLFALRL